MANSSSSKRLTVVGVEAADWEDESRLSLSFTSSSPSVSVEKLVVSRCECAILLAAANPDCPRSVSDEGDES